MLLKIYTSLGTIKIIEKIEDVEIHVGEKEVLTWSDMYRLTTPPIRYARFFATVVENYDWEPKEPGCADSGDVPIGTGPEGQIKTPVKLVDYQRAGDWHRVAILQHAYLCNDEGKTISKIGC